MHLIFLVLAILVGRISSAQHLKPNLEQPSAMLDTLRKKANTYYSGRPREKVYIHFDKSFYISGETSWYKVYVVTESLMPTDVSSVVNVDWIDPLGKLIKHQRLKIENGGAAGDFTIENAFPGGTYTVRAYTNWMRNDDMELFFLKRIMVVNPGSTLLKVQKKYDSTTFDLQFFPEGGNLVHGISTQVAFKAIDTFGRGVNVSGRIVDEEGSVLTSFNALHNGMGTFPLVPQHDKTYRAILDNGETYRLPTALKTGITLSAYNMNADRIFVRIQSREDYKSSTFYLIGQTQSTITYAGYVTLDKDFRDISIPRNQIPEGIFQLTLFDSQGIPRCERKLFVKSEPAMAISIRSNKETYVPRDSVEINLRVRDLNGNPVTTPLSVSVTDASLRIDDWHRENIYTRLLLQSDIKGYIEDPLWYFESQTSEKVHALDLVMLTHGWSTYRWEKILGRLDDNIVFLPEIGIPIEGQITAGNKPVANAPFMLRITQGDNHLTNIYETDSVGKFVVPGLDFFDSSLVSIRIMGKEKLVRTARLQLTQVIDTLHSPLTATQPTSDRRVEEIGRKLGTPWQPDKYKTLEKVTVTAERRTVRNVNNVMVVRPSAADLKSKVASSQFISRYAISLSFATLQTFQDGTQGWGVKVLGKFAPVSISIDGVLMESTGHPITVLNSIPIEEIEQVHIGRGAQIAIWTKNTQAQKVPPAMTTIIEGYYTPREFYHPKYGPTDSFSDVPDNRFTLYWNPNIITDKNGIATIKFYNTDYTKSMLVVAEGIENGSIISGKQLIGTW